MEQEIHLTEDNIRITARVMQALDIEAAEAYLRNHKDNVDPELQASESEVAELAENITHTIAPQIMLCDSHDFRVMYSIYINLLLASRRQDLAEVAIEERFTEQI